jgi:hypothetical protein
VLDQLDSDLDLEVIRQEFEKSCETLKRMRRK